MILTGQVYSINIGQEGQRVEGWELDSNTFHVNVNEN
jgi:hypothetical protein